MGRNYNREPRERGIILPGLGRGKGCRIFQLFHVFIDVAPLKRALIPVQADTAILLFHVFIDVAPLKRPIH